MSGKTKPIKLRKTAADAFDNEPAFDDWDAWDTDDVNTTPVTERLAHKDPFHGLPTGPLTSPLDVARAVQAKANRTRKANRYAAKCVKCGQWVEAEAGYLTKDKAGKWAAEHVGDCPAPKVAQPQVELADVPAGRYALPSTGDNDLVFYKVDRPTEGKWAGFTFVRMIVGGDGSNDQRLNRAQSAPVLARIAEAGFEAAAALYGQHTRHCSRCQLVLTDVVSRVTGFGPTCARKLDLVRPSHAEAMAIAAKLGIDTSEYEEEVVQ
jgi:hypothetical protein